MRAMIGVTLVVAALACAAPRVERRIAVETAESSSIAQQRQVELAMMVKHDCGSCHGLTLKGGLGKPLLRESLQALPQETLAALILDGVPGTAMPPWLGIVTREEAMWIAAGLRQGAFN